MDFDGTVGSDGAGIGVWIRSPFSAQDKVPSKVRVYSINYHLTVQIMRQNMKLSLPALRFFES